jgi:hypothetical protein
VTSTRIVVVPLIAALALLAAGCGKSKPESPSEWASGFCSSVTTWKDSVQSAVSPIKSGNISKDSIQTAYNDFKSATDSFVKDVKNLGKPNTQVGAQAQQDVDQLTTQINTDAQTIKSDVGNVSSVASALTVVPSVTSTLSSMSNEVKLTFHDLQMLDAGGELTTAFQNSSSCKTLKASINKSSS